jgi:uncharacterized repeat protein (TIGR01451 family)
VEASDSVTVVVSPVPVAAISLTKTASKSVVAVGTTVSYEFLVTNTGGLTLRDVTVTDPLLGAVDEPCVDLLEPGETATCSYIGRYVTTKAGGLTNIATATAVAPAGGTTVHATGDVRITVVVPALAFTGATPNWVPIVLLAALLLVAGASVLVVRARR